MKKRYSGPQILSKLRQADVLIGQSKTVPEVCKEINISADLLSLATEVWRKRHPR
jgi:hypothetical protein